MISSYQCPNCGTIYPPETLEWRCHCGGAFVLEKTLPFSKGVIEKWLHSMRRYRAMLLVDRPISLGERGTPAVQAKACAPICEACRGLKPSPTGKTVAEGVNIAQPIRLPQVTDAIRATERDMVTVEEEDILGAQDILARQGLLVEPTSAVPLAALPRLAPRLSKGVTVIPLTGRGLKSLCQT